MIHHECTKDTKASSAVQDASHAVPEELDIEIDEEANFVTGDFEVREELSAVNGGE